MNLQSNRKLDVTATLDRNETSVPLNSPLAGRWSPRGFDANYELEADDLNALLEAARWAPSASNSQPTRLIVGRRGTPTFEAIAAALMDFNTEWAPRASLLIVTVAETVRDGRPLRYAEYDGGQAIAHLTVEAESRGLKVRQMGGFKADLIRQAFELPAEFSPLTVVAVGKHDASESVPEAVREHDLKARARRSLEDTLLVFDA